METLAYAVRLEPAKEGGYVVTCRDLPEVVTQGDDIAEALVQASDAMDEAFAARIGDGEGFPDASAPRRGEYLVAAPSVQIAADVGSAARSRQASCAEPAAASQIGDASGRRAGRRDTQYQGANRSRKEAHASATTQEDARGSLDQPRFTPTRPRQTAPAAAAQPVAPTPNAVGGSTLYPSVAA